MTIDTMYIVYVGHLPVLLLLQTIFSLLFLLRYVLRYVARIGSSHLAQNLLQPFRLGGNRLNNPIQAGPACVSFSNLTTSPLTSTFSDASGSSEQAHDAPGQLG